MIYPIRYYGDPVLRKTATPVQHFDDELEHLASDMLETMYDANGVGLAAPQIGLLKRIFVALQIAPLDEEDAEPEPEADLDTLSPEQKRKRWGVVAEHVMINPEIGSSAAGAASTARTRCLERSRGPRSS
ncbi:MAG: peptide deformylase [Trueperaceae bacterium]|nr:peptide deformylase [Trueperaceae bacterium]